VAILLAAPTCYGLSGFAENDVVNGKCIQDYNGDELDQVLPSPSSVVEVDGTMVVVKGMDCKAFNKARVQNVFAYRHPNVWFLSVIGIAFYVVCIVALVSANLSRKLGK
jgi:hypothetical protein